MRSHLLLSLLLLQGCASTVQQDTKMLAAASFGWLEQDINRIVDGGPFDRSFNKGIYPYMESDIEKWFRLVLPIGTTSDTAQRILDPSFSVDLTSGKKVVIERESGMGGGQSTEVFLHFEKGKFRDVEIHQHWAHL